MSRIPNHTDLHPGRNVFLTRWFILSVLFLTDSEKSVVLHLSGIPNHTDPYPGINIHLTSWVILSVLTLTDGEISVVPTLVQYPQSQVPQSW